MAGMVTRARNLPDDAVAAAGALPLHLRDPDGVLAAQTTLSGIITGRTILDPGPYVATIEMPTGTQITHPLQVAPDGRIDLADLLSRLQKRLEGHSEMHLVLPNFAPASPHIVAPPSGIAPLITDLAGVAGLLSSLSASAGSSGGLRGMSIREAPPCGWQIEGWRGTALGRNLLPLDSAELGAVVQDDLQRVGPVSDEQPTTVRLTPPGREPMNLVLPPGTAAVVSSNAAVRIETGDATVDELLRLRASGRVVGLAAVTSEVDAGLVRNRLDRPGAALAATYRMLRVNAADLDEALGALEPLAGLADTLVLRAERVARAGGHVDALPLFLAACALDLPAFSSGLGFVIDRMRRYAFLGRTGNEDELRASGLPGTAPGQARATLAAIQPFALRCEFALPLVLYRGPVELSPASLEPEPERKENIP